MTSPAPAAAASQGESPRDESPVPIITTMYWLLEDAEREGYSDERIESVLEEARKWIPCYSQEQIDGAKRTLMTSLMTSLSDFADKIESGESIPVTRLERQPDGSVTRTKAALGTPSREELQRIVENSAGAPPWIQDEGECPFAAEPVAGEPEPKIESLDDVIEEIRHEGNDHDHWIHEAEMFADWAERLQVAADRERPPAQSGNGDPIDAPSPPAGQPEGDRLAYFDALLDGLHPKGMLHADCLALLALAKSQQAALKAACAVCVQDGQKLLAAKKDWERANEDWLKAGNERDVARSALADRERELATFDEAARYLGWKDGMTKPKNFFMVAEVGERDVKIGTLTEQLAATKSALSAAQTENEALSKDRDYWRKDGDRLAKEWDAAKVVMLGQDTALSTLRARVAELEGQVAAKSQAFTNHDRWLSQVLPVRDAAMNVCRALVNSFSDLGELLGSKGADEIVQDARKAIALHNGMHTAPAVSPAPQEQKPDVPTTPDISIEGSALAMIASCLADPKSAAELERIKLSAKAASEAFKPKPPTFEQMHTPFGPAPQADTLPSSAPEDWVANAAKEIIAGILSGECSAETFAEEERDAMEIIRRHAPANSQGGE